MSEIITVYKINCFASLDPSLEGESCSLFPWDDSTPDCRGQDDGGREYVLPHGYARGETEDGIPALFDKDGCPCEILLHNGQPLLIDSGKRRAYPLEPVKKMASYREMAGLSLAELAALTGFSQKELYEWENLEKQPGKEALEKIAGVLGCKMSDFL
jgi:hypothetical protein